jgi:hypothetical protein
MKMMRLRNTVHGQRKLEAVKWQNLARSGRKKRPENNFTIIYMRNQMIIGNFLDFMICILL